MAQGVCQFMLCMFSRTRTVADCGAINIHLPAFGLRAGDVQLAPGALKLWRLVYRMLIIERLPQQAHSAKTCLPISPGHTLKQERLIQIQQAKKYPPFTKRVLLRYRDFRQTLF